MDGLQWAATAFAGQAIINILGPDTGDWRNRDAMLIDDLGADSLDILEIQMELETHGVAVPDSVLHGGVRVGDLADCVLSAYRKGEAGE